MAKTQDNVSQFESALKDLEALVARMESGDLSLEDSLQSYEQGIRLFRQCQSALEQAQMRVQLLSDPSQPDAAKPFAERDDAPF